MDPSLLPESVTSSLRAMFDVEDAFRQTCLAHVRRSLRVLIGWLTSFFFDPLQHDR